MERKEEGRGRRKGEGGGRKERGKGGKGGWEEEEGRRRGGGGGWEEEEGNVICIQVCIVEVLTPRILFSQWSRAVPPPPWFSSSTPASLGQLKCARAASYGTTHSHCVLIPTHTQNTHHCCSELHVYAGLTTTWGVTIWFTVWETGPVRVCQFWYVTVRMVVASH